MKKIKVKFVKYDMTKTKNRKRNDMLVDTRTEKSVRTQLERIHKGEQVIAIHELEWDEEQIEQVLKEDAQEQVYYGTVKFFESEKGFGFIKPEDDMDDLFFHRSACSNGLPQDRDEVEFRISKGPKGLIAVGVKIIGSGT